MPSLWRALQCLRSFLDSGKELRHLANCGKYAIAILHYTMLSAHRVHGKTDTKIAFVTFAMLHAIYGCCWDFCQDWDLGHRNAEWFLLRQHLAYDHAWLYYLAGVTNAVLRSSWILYVVYPKSSLVSFSIALAEVVRRGIWSSMRLEAMHCAEVQRLPADAVAVPRARSSCSHVMSDVQTVEQARLSLHRVTECARGEFTDRLGRPKALKTEVCGLNNVLETQPTKPNTAFLTRGMSREL